MRTISERMHPLFRSTVVLLLLLLPLLLTGCEVSDAEIDFVVDIVLDWAIEKNLITADCPPPYDSEDCNFGLNAKELARWKAGNNATLGVGMDIFGVDRVDPEVDAALDAAEVVYTMEKADALAEEGLAEGDLGKIDQAIKLRPEDWSYHDQRAALLLSQGNADAAQDSFEEANSLVAERINTGGNCKALQLNLLRNREQVLSQQSQQYPQNESLRNELGKTQSLIWAVETGHESSPCP